MNKNLFLRLCLVVGMLLSLAHCRTEDEFSSQSKEAGNIQYGISKQTFLQTKFADLLATKSGKNTAGTAAELSPEELSEKLDLDKAHLTSYQGKEMLHVPVRVLGNYKRSLFSVSQNQKSYTYLLTYPNPNDHRHFLPYLSQWRSYKGSKNWGKRKRISAAEQKREKYK